MINSIGAEVKITFDMQIHIQLFTQLDTLDDVEREKRTVTLSHCYTVRIHQDHLFITLLKTVGDFQISSRKINWP